MREGGGGERETERARAIARESANLHQFKKKSALIIISNSCMHACSGFKVWGFGYASMFPLLYHLFFESKPLHVSTADLEHTHTHTHTHLRVHAP
jgi:hypothetical protein